MMVISLRHGNTTAKNSSLKLTRPILPLTFLWVIVSATERNVSCKNVGNSHCLLCALSWPQQLCSLQPCDFKISMHTAFTLFQHNIHQAMAAGQGQAPSDSAIPTSHAHPLPEVCCPRTAASLSFLQLLCGLGNTLHL